MGTHELVRRLLDSARRRHGRTLLLALFAGPVAAAALAVASPPGDDHDRPGGTAPAALAAAAADLHRGGTLRLLSDSGFGTIDPQVNYLEKYFQVSLGVYDGLIGFRRVAGDAGLVLVPDLAEALPVVSDGGRTYTFHLRDGIRFSDGSPLTVGDVLASYQRLFKVHSPTADSWFHGIVGADQCLKVPASCSLAGGVTVESPTRAVVFHLRAPDPDFLFKVAYPHAVIVPATAPPHDMGSSPLPGTGPYRIVSYDPRKRLQLARNPHFREWSQEAQPDGHVDAVNYDFGLGDEDEVTAIENGQADWTFDTVPVDRLNEVGTRFAHQVHVSPLKAVYYLTMNTRRAPFADQRVRQAVNFALDRRALVRIYGGPNVAAPACQFLPPGFQGHESYCPYTLAAGTQWSAPDLERARALVQASGTRGQKVTLIVTDTAVERQIGTYLQSVLTDLGYAVAVKSLSTSVQFTYIQNTRNEVQASVSAWYQDYPAASDFLVVHFSCGNFHPDSDVSINISGLCDPELEAALERAQQADANQPASADHLWALADHRVSDLAPVAPLFHPRRIDFAARRVGNFLVNGRYGWLYTQAWVQ
jgi:peptide/nickel transport system substrate-binding protein